MLLHFLDAAVIVVVSFAVVVKLVSLLLLVHCCYIYVAVVFVVADVLAPIFNVVADVTDVVVFWQSKIQ